ncbi:MAG TPA: hypothetical protein VFG73_06280 [Rhodanobacteraceae bacterium]|nr:hypothetical protein [Rhodanobacteraceae bacterium]
MLDGFTLTGGDNTNDDLGGGALLCRGGNSGNACNPTLANLVFSGNEALYGGAVELDGFSGGDSSPTLTNTTFSGNSGSSCGGMYNYGVSGTSSPTLINGRRNAPVRRRRCRSEHRRSCPFSRPGFSVRRAPAAGSAG